MKKISHLSEVWSGILDKIMQTKQTAFSVACFSGGWCVVCYHDMFSFITDLYITCCYLSTWWQKQLAGKNDPFVKRSSGISIFALFFSSKFSKLRRCKFASFELSGRLNNQDQITPRRRRLALKTKAAQYWYDSAYSSDYRNVSCTSLDPSCWTKTENVLAFRTDLSLEYKHWAENQD